MTKPRYWQLAGFSHLHYTYSYMIIILSECSTKFARIIGKGNPTAVLMTMILILSITVTFVL